MADNTLHASGQSQDVAPVNSNAPGSPESSPGVADAGPAILQAGSDSAAAGKEEITAADPIASAAADILPAGTDISSSLIVDGTLWVLIAFSVATWALILIKGIQHLRVSYSNKAFGKKFWAAQNLQAATQLQDYYKGPVGRVARAGFNTLIEAEGGTTTHDLEHTGDRQELLERRLRQQVQKERGALESGLAILATVGSISPFVGLFGTVWGIMGALTSISKSGSASLDVVAGPIGEALIATAVGIAVAVPAVIAYNFFIRRNKVTLALLDDFAIDFIHLALKTSFLIGRDREAATLSARNAESAHKKPSVVKTSNHEPLIAKGAPA